MKKVKYILKKYDSLFCLLFLLALPRLAFSQKQEDGIFYLMKIDWSATKNIDKAAYFMQVIQENDSTYICRFYNKYGPMIRQETFLDSALSIPNGRFCWYDAKGNLDSI
jgi:hypothetical protein